MDAASTISKRQTRPLTTSGYWAGFVYLRIASDLRRLQSVGAAARITPVLGNPSYPASLLPENSPHSYPHSPDLVRFPAFFPVIAVRRSRRLTGWYFIWFRQTGRWCPWSVAPRCGFCPYLPKRFQICRKSCQIRVARRI